MVDFKNKQTKAQVHGKEKASYLGREPLLGVPEGTTHAIGALKPVHTSTQRR